MKLFNTRSASSLVSKSVLRPLLIAAMVAPAMAKTAPAMARTAPATSQRMVPALVSELAAYRADDARIDADLVRFDTLDFDVYSHQQWDRLKESHAPDILVHYPDGHTSQGLAAHVEELKPAFVFAPDSRVSAHPVKFGKGEWTAVIGLFEGTFTQPMPIGNGKTVAPTGKAFKVPMTTVGHWRNGVMDEEFLFWDNAGFMKQIGLGQ